MPFPVLLDSDGTAASVVATKTIGVGALVRPTAIGAALRSWRTGHRQGKAGPRPTQLGATVVLGPGDEILYEDREEFAGDHASLDEVIAAVRR